MHPNFNNVPFFSKTLPSHALTFKGALITLTLPREEVVTVRGPIHRAQPPFHRSPRSPILHRAVVGAELDLPKLPWSLLSGTRHPSRPVESCDSQGRFPDSFPRASRLGTISRYIQAWYEQPWGTVPEQSSDLKWIASYNLWLHPLVEHATKEGQVVSTPFWSTSSNEGLPTEAQVATRDPAIGGERANVGARTTEEKQGPPKGSEGQIHNEPQNSRSQHRGTIHHRITEASKGAQYGTLKILLGAKVTNDMSGRDSEASCLSRGTPVLSQAPFLIGLPGARFTDK
ncbi:hypothetical protein CRG98_017836 [Punica granatum]|uniref:Uncharacterized protein n=1 Tax=Punica granatum TaxID=22663 RepID=A0A2I0K275_PUNGR|nr:hypothetical protein CRG98_017836 [Punica granatum]